MSSVVFSVFFFDQRFCEIFESDEDIMQYVVVCFILIFFIKNLYTIHVVIVGDGNADGRTITVVYFFF